MFLQLVRLWNRLRGRVFTFLCRPGFHGIGSRSVLLPPLRITGERSIEIGSDVVIGPNSWLHVLDEAAREAPVITIGDGTSSSGFLTITAARRVTIEPNVLIARYVYISDHSHACDSQLVPIKEQGITKIAPVRICEGAWLGQGAVICPGVTVGRNAVVGANSVVRHDVPDFCVAAGVPAQIIRRVHQEQLA